MAFSGWLVKVNGTEVPMKCVKYETYKVTPNQRMESEAERDVTGKLHRTTVEHTASKIEFETPHLFNDDMESLVSVLSISGNAERKVTVNYFDPETNGYKSGEFYIPDINYSIYNVDTDNDKILYAPTRIAFIEY